MSVKDKEENRNDGEVYKVLIQTVIKYNVKVDGEKLKIYIISLNQPQGNQSRKFTNKQIMEIKQNANNCSVNQKKARKEENWEQRTHEANKKHLARWWT